VKGALWTRRTAVAAALGAALVGAAFMMGWDTAHDKGQDMISLKTNDWAASYEPFPEDIAEIEGLWGAPIPPNASFIGGHDWPAWGSFTRHTEDPEGIVRGAARDRSHFYEGNYRAESGSFDVSAGIDFSAFEISGLDGEKVLLYRRNQPPPVEYFFLVPTQPEAIRRRPSE